MRVVCFSKNNSNSRNLKIILPPLLNRAGASFASSTAVFMDRTNQMRYSV